MAIEPLVAASVGALADLQARGLLRHIGVSNISVAELREAQQIATIVSVQNMYNLAERGSADVLEVCTREGMAFLPWYPLATGNLARAGGVLQQVAARHRATPAQVALAWLLHRSPVMLPIPGTSSLAHLDENLAAAALKLGAEDILVETADSYRVATLGRRLASISYHHKQARHQLPTKDPEVERTMRRATPTPCAATSTTPRSRARLSTRCWSSCSTPRGGSRSPGAPYPPAVP